ncbi:MAG TPA: Crp/Fnr family transcriptional regulator [Salinimicrobium sp.]|nr:Crp/Fnr family transcriptional regulator [Salinimicrobium sp.]
MEKWEDNRWNYIEALKTSFLFRDLDSDILEVISDNFKLEKLDRNSSINSTRKLQNYFYFIISGKVKAYTIDRGSGREYTLAILAKDDVFDLLCLLEDCEHNTYFEALANTVLLFAPMSRMRGWIGEYPVINRNLFPYLGKRLREMEQYATSMRLSIPTRLAWLILYHINGQSQKLELINDLSNEELAGLVGTSRAVVNRHLQNFKSDGTLYIGRKKIEIKNLQLLLKRIEKDDF